MVTGVTIPPNPYTSYRFFAFTSLAGSVALVNLLPGLAIAKSYIGTAVVLFLLQVTSYAVYAVVIYPFFLSPLRHLPGPSGGHPILGQWLTIIKEPSGAPLRRWSREIPNDGLIRYRSLFNKERLLLTTPKALSEVLTVKPYDFIRPELLRSGVGQILGIGILFAEGDDHKIQRKNLMPAFNFRHIKELYPIFWSKSQEMARCIAEEMSESTEKTVELGGWVSRATLDIIGVAGMGQDFNSLADPNTELNQTYRKIFAPSRAGQILGFMSFFLPNWFLRLLPVKRNEDVVAASKVARDTAQRLVEQKKRQLANKENMSPDIVSIALESGHFSDLSLVDNMMTFLAAGHETTAAAFTWATYLLCQNPEKQKILRKEIHKHIPSSNSTIDHTLIDNMPYLHAVCNEALRLYPPVPITLRDTLHDTTVLGHFVPRGTSLVLAPWATNTAPSLWGLDADEFKPERWTAPGQANAGGAVSNYAMLTFLHGPRSCIGQRFATAELACLLAAFVGRFEFEMKDPDEVIEIKGGLTARPKNGLTVNLRPIEGW